MSILESKTFTAFLIIISAFLFALNYFPFQQDEQIIPEISYGSEKSEINISSLSLRQKIAQMVIVYDIPANAEYYGKNAIGGIFFSAKGSQDEFKESISYYRNTTVIPYFFSVDLEGCINPFEKFREFPSFNEISDEEDAYALGLEQGNFLNEIGINLNFAPVLDLSDSIWKCRAFNGSPEDIPAMGASYIRGLQEKGIIATSKHYPGQTLCVDDPHKKMVMAQITDDDLLPFEVSIKNNVSAIMVSHIVASGGLDSGSKPSVVSNEVIAGLKNKFTGLIITDEIRMLGLKNHYKDESSMYRDLFIAGNDIILNFKSNPEDIDKMISSVEHAVKSGELSEDRIDLSVVKILNAKGIKVVQ